jgi:hypothetical protein
MAARSIGEVRATLLRHTYRQCTEYAAAALSADGPSEGRARVRAAIDSTR